MKVRRTVDIHMHMDEKEFKALQLFIGYATGTQIEKIFEQAMVQNPKEINGLEIKKYIKCLDNIYKAFRDIMTMKYMDWS